jgi:hypothetical protein
VSRFQNKLPVRSSAPVCQGIPLKPAFVLFQVRRTLQKYFFIGSDFKIAILKSPQVLVGTIKLILPVMSYMKMVSK